MYEPTKETDQPDLGDSSSEVKANTWEYEVKKLLFLLCEITLFHPGLKIQNKLGVQGDTNFMAGLTIAGTNSSRLTPFASKIKNESSLIRSNQLFAVHGKQML